jgi:hypothetical protein
MYNKLYYNVPHCFALNYIKKILKDMVLWSSTHDYIGLLISLWLFLYAAQLKNIS